MDPPTVDPPLRGEWKVIHNPGDAPHAFDFVGLRPGSRLPYPPRSLLPHLVYRTPASAAYGWDRPVYAPVDGDVIETHDGHPDTATMNLPRDLLRNVVLPPGAGDGIQRFAGNYVVVDSSEGIAFMAHLRRGSVAVKPGDRVSAGEVIGAVGNAGASLLPHLHFQVMDGWTDDPGSVADRVVPFRVSRYELREGGTWRTVNDRAPEHGDRIRTGETGPGP